MPFTTRDSVRLYWKLDGAAGRPPIVLLHSIGTDMDLWDGLLPHLLHDVSTLRIDIRGHGASDAPAGDYCLGMLAADVAAVMADAVVTRAMIVGVSLGGMVAMQLALDHPERVSALVLVCTSPTMDPVAWQTRIDAVRQDGTAAIANFAIGRFLSAPFIAAHPEVADSLTRAISAQADTGYAGAAAAIRDMQLADRLTEINIPTLVMTAAADVSTPFIGHGDTLLHAIAGARHVALDGAHLPPIEAPVELASALLGHLHGDA